MEYQGFIFTKHALERINDRSVTKDMVTQTLRHPDRTQPTDKPGVIKFIRQFGDRPVHVVATLLPDQKKWLIVSVWVRGEEDKVPLAWKLITFPFKLFWWLCRFLWQAFKKNKGSAQH
jgi:hypothetical protein